MPINRQMIQWDSQLKLVHNINLTASIQMAPDFMTMHLMHRPTPTFILWGPETECHIRLKLYGGKITPVRWHVKLCGSNAPECDIT